jgi:hypothetical protein
VTLDRHDAAASGGIGMRIGDSGNVPVTRLGVIVRDR